MYALRGINNNYADFAGSRSDFVVVGHPEFNLGRNSADYGFPGGWDTSPIPRYPAKNAAGEKLRREGHGPLVRRLTSQASPKPLKERALARRINSAPQLLAGGGSGGGGAAAGENWRLWHVRRDAEQDLYEYPRESLMTGDGQGGVWMLCPTAADDGGEAEDEAGTSSPDWCLWHVTDSWERNLFQYHRSSQMSGDGRGGVWILCQTKCRHNEEGGWHLWHANQAGEHHLQSYPGVSRIITTGAP
mmetsp:Transcript_24480/g.68780  ORF Transcript_24480/g.68780 Transcript_24480/m.68780 type:complete len:245 (+) Transcript_24480:140-874(+)